MKKWKAIYILFAVCIFSSCSGNNKEFEEMKEQINALQSQLEEKEKPAETAAQTKDQLTETTALTTAVNEETTGVTTDPYPDMERHIEDSFEYIDNDTGINIIKYLGSDPELNIPEFLYGKSVTEIGRRAFETCEGITSISIPSSVTKIDSEAFAGCSSLINISIPDSVEKIGAFAFLETPWLEKKRGENPLVVVNGILIDGKTASGDITIPNNVIKINGGAFWRCENLTDISIPDSVKIIANEAFYDCPNIQAAYKGKIYNYDNINDLYSAING